MIALRDFFGSNPWALAAVSLCSLISFAALVLPTFWRLLKYLRTAVSSSIYEANRRRDIRRMFRAMRCLEEPSYFIAMIIERTLITFLPVTFLSQNILDVLDRQPTKGWTPAMLTTTDKLILLSSIAAIVLGVLQLLSYLFQISARVRLISEHRRIAAKKAKGIKVVRRLNSRGRVRL